MCVQIGRQKRELGARTLSCAAASLALTGQTVLGLLLELGDNASNDIEHCASNVQTMAKWIDDDEDD